MLDVAGRGWNGGGLIYDAPKLSLPLRLRTMRESSQHLIVRHHLVSLGHDLLRTRKKALINYGLNNVFAAHPAIWRIFYTPLPEKPRRAVVHAISNIVLILEDIVDFMIRSTALRHGWICLPG